MRTGRIVVVTGAAGGVGRLVVERFLADGDVVVAIDLEGHALKALAEAQAPGARLRTITADTSREADCAIVAALTWEVHGRVDVLVNVARALPVQPFEMMTAEDFRRVVDVNMTGVFMMIKAMAPLLRGRGWGRIVTVGAASIFEGVADQVHHVAARAGLVGLSRSLACVFGSDGITVNVVTSGLAPTSRAMANLPADLVEGQVARRATPRTKTGEDVVGAIAFLSSLDADFITGQTVDVDGGEIMLRKGTP